MRLSPVLPALLLWCAGCGEVEQTAACADYVRCLEARDAVLGTETDADRFDVGGACWGGAEGAHLCDTACSNGLAWLRDVEPDLPAECAP